MKSISLEFSISRWELTITGAFVGAAASLLVYLEIPETWGYAWRASPATSRERWAFTGPSCPVSQARDTFILGAFLAAFLSGNIFRSPVPRPLSVLPRLLRHDRRPYLPRVPVEGLRPSRRRRLERHYGHRRPHGGDRPGHSLPVERVQQAGRPGLPHGRGPLCPLPLSPSLPFFT